MKRSTKAAIITAVAFLLIGCIVFVVGMTLLNWDFSKISTAKFESNTYTVNQKFGSINIDANTADITLAVSDDGKCRVECYENTKEKHMASVENDTIVIKAVNKKAWHDYMGINFTSPRITLYLPEKEYESLVIHTETGHIEVSKDFEFGDAYVKTSTGRVKFFANASDLVEIETTTGDILVEDMFAGTIDLTVSTGKITLCDVTCKSLMSKGSTGDTVLKGVIAAKSLDIDRSTGDINLEGCDAAEICITTDTGDISGTLLTDKVFIAHSDTGKIDLPETLRGGKCKIITDTGDIRIRIK